MWTAALERGLSYAIDNWIVSRRELNKFSRRRVARFREKQALRVFMQSMYFSIIWSLKKQHHKEKRRLLRPTHGETHLTGLSNRRFGAV